MAIRALWLAFAGAVLMHGAAWAADPLSVCIDSASATASRDQKLAEAVAKREGVPLAVAHFDSGDNGDDGVSAKEFKQLLATRCELVMGYPVDLTSGSTPPELMQTSAYDQTGFVLVVPRASPAKSLADLPKGTAVAVTFETAPNLYFLNHPNVAPDVHTTDADTLQAVVDGKVQAAMVWQPTVQAYLAGTPSAQLSFYPLAEPHARWNVVALYTSRGAEAAKGFDAAVVALQASGGFDPSQVRKQSADGFDPAMILRAADAPGGAPPALYTAAQATEGAAVYAADCAQCHGPQLQGLAGPALKGSNFASVKAGFAVGDIFMIVSQNMPASNPGSLKPDEYVKVMAFLLQQNGYPAGPAELTFNGASGSTVPMLYHGN
jgi:ABC-type amino acid transport substrate-binding protein